jgi:hypothetical protein
MSHTTVAGLGVDFEANFAGNEPDTVFFADERWVGTGTVGEWDTVDLDVPFQYNGFDNLLVEVTWNGTECGEEDAVVQYGPSPDGTNRRAWEFDWQATVAQRADVNEFNLLLGFEDSGIEEGAEGERSRAEPCIPSLVHGVLSLRPAADGPQQELLDATGQKVLDLHPGSNDVSRLSPGVYFVSEGSGGQGFEGPSVRKVVVQR